MEKAKKLIGFEPKYSMKDSIAYIKEWIDAGGLTEEGRSADQSYGSGVSSPKE